ncbi:MAG: hypothetical protein GX562_01165 [Coriobacteriaceae bacterium]|nr:hypothetical protein [Coriobacteriaceae bacterium]
MSVLISHKSALEFWRRYKFGKSPIYSATRISKAPKKIDPVQIAGIASRLDLSYPLDVLIANKGAGVVNEIVHSHYCTRPLPGNSVVRIDQELLISTPEFCFLQNACSLPLEIQILLGYEFCGSYRMTRAFDGDDIHAIDLESDTQSTPKPLLLQHSDRSQSIAEQGFRSDCHLTSVFKMRVLLDKAAGFHGVKQARRALRHILENSASPMETRLSMLLTLPALLGGFNLPHPLMNSRIQVGKQNSRGANQQFYIADLYWPEAKLAVEYDSDSFHTGAIQIAKDSMRRNALSYMGIKVIAITRKQLKDTDSLKRAVNLISKYLQRRQRYGAARFIQEHQRLRHTLGL